MKPFSLFRKPEWQSPDPQRRALAVAGDDSSELLAALPRLALEDPDAAVRRHALRRSDDPALFARAASGDADATVRAWARQQWLGAILSGRIECTDSELAGLNADEREKLASSSGDRTLRERALQRIDRAGFLVERIQSDPDPAIRLALMERIDNPVTLDRLAEQLRRKNKQLSRAASDRAETLRLASGDVATRERLAETICVELETLIRSAIDAEGRQRQMDQALARWQSLGPETLSERLRTRVDGACAVLRVQIEPPAPVVPSAPPEPEPAAVPVPTPEELAAQVRLEAEIARNQAEQALERQRQREQAEQLQQQLQVRQRENSALVEQLAQALDAGESTRARDLAARIDADHLSASAQRRWNDVQPALKELQGWAAWANNKVRARLCTEVERLIGSGLHPDALSGRIQEIQQQWRELDAAEGRGDGSAPSGLDKRLQVAVARALKPAREFFDKRRELRNEQRGVVGVFLDEAEKALSPDNEAVEIPALLALQKQAIEHLRSLDRLQGSERKQLGRRLRELLDAIKPRIEASFAAVEQAKQGLIEAAQALVGESDRRRVAGEAKRLNERWKEAGKGRSGRDQKLWQQFRAALDDAFAHLDRERQAQTEQQQQQHQAAEALVVEVETLAHLAGDELAGSEAALRSLRERWQAFSVRDGGLAERYDNALTFHREAIKSQRQDKQRERLLAMLEAPETAEASDSTAGDAADRALELVFEAEALVAIDPPESEREIRRHWQLRRLQDHLRGGGASSTSKRSDLEALLSTWRELASTLDGNSRNRLTDRLRQVIVRFKGE